MKTILSIILLLFTFTTFAQRGYIKSAIEEKYKEEQGPDGNGALNKWMYGNLMNVKVEPNYIFTIKMVMHVKDYKKGKLNEENDMEIFSNPSKKNTGSTIKSKKEGESYVIFDGNQNAMISINPSEKTVSAFTANAFMSKETQEKIKNNETKESNINKDYDCKKTGKTKTLLGYKCEEYYCTNIEKNTKTIFWVSTETANYDFNTFLKMNKKSSTHLPFSKGAVLHTLFYKNDVIESEMEVTSLNKNANFTISTKGYTINGK